jgi:hypothetical protein
VVFRAEHVALGEICIGGAELPEQIGLDVLGMCGICTRR